MSIKSTICMYFGDPHTGCLPRYFKDWYEFADYVQQETLTGRPVTIYKWSYISL